MEPFSRDERKRIFLSELHQLEEKEYITRNQFQEIAKAHNEYYYDIRTKQEEKSLDIPVKKQKPVVVITPKKKPEKKMLSAEELRERNITWSLNLGVILLLIGGLFVATSNWETMENWSKSGIIGLVAILFYGISYLSKKVLKIEQTGFAFMILGSLFLPIFLLSIGWFKLVGEYLSLTGEGRYLFGFISCVLLVPVYGAHAKRLASRLFVWFTFLVFSIGAAFAIATLGLVKDWFYFGLMLFNILTVLIFHRMKKLEALKLFANELVFFAQIQLVLTSLIMLVFFENHLLNGVNLFISAAVYLAMVFVSGRKEYHFIFSAMVVYGAYQIFEHSALDEFGPVLYVLVGSGFLLVPRLFADKISWNRIFQFTSAVVSGLVFLAISIESILIRLNEPSIPLLLAYLLLAGQFIYLANIVKKLLFSYLSPIFILAAFYEIVLMIDNAFEFESLFLPIFFSAFLLFVIFGFFQKQQPLIIIKRASRDIALAVMGIVIVASFAELMWLELGIMLSVLCFVLFLSIRVEDRLVYTETIPWLMAFSIASAFSAFGEELRDVSKFYQTNLGFSMNAVLGSLAAFLASYGWMQAGEKRLSSYSYYIGLVSYTIAMVCALLFQVNEQWVKPLILFVGIFIYLHYYLKKKFSWLPYTIGVITLIWYFTALNSVYLQVEVPLFLRSLEFSFGGALLLMVCYWLRNKGSNAANGFAWVGHLYLPLSLLVTFFLYYELAIWSFVLSMILYTFSTYSVKTEWKIKCFLYGAFTSLFFVILIGIMEHTEGIESPYAFLVTSGLILCYYWFVSNKSFKLRSMYYFVPFSGMGIMTFLMSYPYGLSLYVMTLLYSFILLIFLHIHRWQLGTLLPLLFTFIATMQYLQLGDMGEIWKLLISAGIGVILIGIGRTLYQNVIRWNEKGWVTLLDSYTITAFLFLGSSYLYRPDALWANLIPGVLISSSLLFQRKRIPEAWSMWLSIFGGLYLLEPYYSTVFNLAIPDLWEREIMVLPGLVAVIYLRYCFREKYRRLSSQLQWGMLVVISLLLVQDGLESNTIYDALILGTLSLVSMLAGIFLKVKSYFFVGAGVLLLNVFLQTRPLWGNLPWWAYLLISGSILIIVASYNEWHKQKIAKGEATAITLLKQKILVWFKKWD